MQIAPINYTNVIVPPCYQKLYTTKKQLIIEKSGRTAGKTKNTAIYIVLQALQAKNEDIVLCRDSYSDMRDSLFAEVLGIIDELGYSEQFTHKQNPLRVKCLSSGCNIYFMGIGGSDKSRTKSFKPINPKVRLFVFEELQQVRELENLEQAMASFRRHLSDDGKFIFLFNPPAQNAHWVNVWAKEKSFDADYDIINSSWLNIIPHLSDFDIKEILKCQMLEPEKYDWLYMGKTGGGFGSVYPQFKREKHLLTFAQAQKKFQNQKIQSVIIGGDNAVSHDATCLCPIAIFTNGQCCVLDLYYHDPQTSGDLSVAEQIPLIKQWLHELESKYNLNDPIKKTPIAFIIDGSVIGLELVKQLRYTLNSGRYQILAYSEKHIIEMASNLKSVFARNMLYVIDFGGHYNYALARWEKRDNVLAEQLENLIWNEKQTGFDPIVPNDASDALTYGANAIFKNMFNLYYVQDAINTRKDYYDVEGGSL